MSIAWEQLVQHFGDRGIPHSELSTLRGLLDYMRGSQEWQHAADLCYEDWVEYLVSSLNQARLSRHPVAWPVPGRRDPYWLRWGVGLLLYLLAVTLASVELTGSLWPWSRGEPPGLA
ncbi:hypothetical protein GT347_02510 [Xylophilus rhododendri]|uniref:Uncharacterized protein n=1 Tax=Xylophilus rhododendri TaxID=2697032 RepID=A0A857J256_9BURK|nr:hypothetical protein [Xylophilus rhododendri]QHI96955.1 hypothetical protein GT347_02510 [Xylophilus rhododendri]